MQLIAMVSQQHLKMEKVEMISEQGPEPMQPIAMVSHQHLKEKVEIISEQSPEPETIVTIL